MMNARRMPPAPTQRTMQHAPSQAHPQPSKHETKSALLLACCLTLNLSLLGSLNIQMESFLVSRCIKNAGMVKNKRHHALILQSFR